MHGILRRSGNKDFKQVLQRANVFHVADKPADDGSTYSYFSVKINDELNVLLELGTSGDGNLAVAVRCSTADLLPLVQQSLQTLLA